MIAFVVALVVVFILSFDESPDLHLQVDDDDDDADDDDDVFELLFVWLALLLLLFCLLSQLLTVSASRCSMAYDLNHSLFFFSHSFTSFSILLILS